MKTFQQIGTEIGALVQEKNRAYGSSFQTVGAAMRLLYPQGIRPAQMDDALLLTRIWDKMMRIATDRDALGESPYGDITGYGILGVSMHQKQENAPSCPGSASGQNAAEKPKAQQGSAAPSTKRRTTRNAGGSSARKSSPSRSASSASTLAPGSISTESAPAPGATAIANAREDALEKLRKHARRLR